MQIGGDIAAWWSRESGKVLLLATLFMTSGWLYEHHDSLI